MITKAQKLRIFFISLACILIAACTGSSTNGLYLNSGNPRFGDNDPVKWPSYTPWHYPVHGIDVSKYQGEIDWQSVKRNRISFAFIKATEGGDHIDPKFKINWIEAAKARLPRGAYHFYYLCRPAASQAQWFINNVPSDPRALPPVLDMEWNHGSKTCKHRPSPQKIRSEMKIFLSMIARHYGKRPIIYTTVDFYKDNRLGSVLGYEFWLRSVADHPRSIYPGQKWSFWQYTGTGQIPGIEGNADINVFSGSQDQWQEWVRTRTQ